MIFAKSVMLGLVVFSSSCKKETMPVSLSSELKTFAYEPPKEAVIPLIKSFLEKKVAYKTTSITPDETQDAAVWLVEAASNYSYDSEPTAEYSIEYESINLSVVAYDDPITGERMIDGTSLMSAYNSLDLQIQTMVIGMSTGEGIMIVDIEPDIANQTSSSTDFEAKVAKYSLNLTGVGADDDWEAWGFKDSSTPTGWIEGDHCTGGFPDYGGAPRRLTDLINYNYPKVHADFYTSVQTVINNGGSASCHYGVTNGTNYTNWFFGTPGNWVQNACTSSEPTREIFKSMITKGTTCLDNSILQQEYANLWRLIVLETPANKTHINTLVNWDFPFSQGGFSHGWHTIFLTSGIPQIHSTN